MADGDGARLGGELGSELGDEREDGRLVAMEGVVLQVEADRGGVGVGNRAEMHSSVRVGQDYRVDGGAQRPVDVEAAGGEQAVAEAETLGAVVVAGNHDDRDFSAEDETLEDLVQEADCGRGGHGSVVDVAGDDDGVDGSVFREGDELVEDVGLVFEE